MKVYSINSETGYVIEIEIDKESDFIRLPPLTDNWYYEIEK